MNSKTNIITTQQDLSSQKKAFVPELRKLVIHYDNPRIGAAGDSKGMVEFIQSRLPQLAQNRPFAEFAVQKRPNSPPELIAYYMNGSIKRHICYRLDGKQIEKHAKYLCDTAAAGKPTPAMTGEEEENLEAVASVEKWVRTRKNPRGATKEANIDIKAAEHDEWKHRYWKNIRKVDWKSVGRQSDRKYPVPVLRSEEASPVKPWDPFTADKTFRP
jgi:hypothetical protein